MSSVGYTVEVTSLSPKATEKDVRDFFALSGFIENVEIIRSGDYACTAYVTFKDAYSQETACLLSGATILDQRVCITRWGQYQDEFDFWNRPSYSHEEQATPITPPPNLFVSSAAQEVVKTMLEKGCVLSKDALSKAKDFDESHHFSAIATAKVHELSQRIGLSDKISAGIGAVRSVDQRYNVSETTMAAASTAGRSVAAAANSVVNSSYVSNGALWLSGALTRAAQAASDFGNRRHRQ